MFIPLTSVLSFFFSIKNYSVSTFYERRDFQNLDTLKILFHSLVSSHLEFAVIIWNPVMKETAEAIETIQKLIF